jgi:hypothetical protein
MAYPDLGLGGDIAAGKSPCGGPVARKERGRLAPLGECVLARLIHAAAGRLNESIAAEGGTLQPSGCRMERSRFQRTYGAPPPMTAILFAVPILVEDCAAAIV